MQKTVFCTKVKQGKPDRGALKKRFEDQLKRQLSQAGIDHSRWEQIAEDRALWRATIKEIAGQFEKERKLTADTKRQRRKQAPSQLQTPDQVFICPRCTRTCRLRIVLHRHHRACDGNNRTTFQRIFGYEE